MRIAIDTNVLVAAVTSPRSNAARIVRDWLDGRLEVVASEATLREAELVLGGGWLRRVASRDEVRDLLQRLRTQTVRAPERWITDLRLKDEGDRRLVEAAVGGDAAYLITTDREVLKQRGYASTEFVTPSEFLKLLRRTSG